MSLHRMKDMKNSCPLTSKYSLTKERKLEFLTIASREGRHYNNYKLYINYLQILVN